MTDRRGFRSLFAPLVLALVLISTPAAAAGPSGALPIAENGFGDSQNSYSWSMAWFKGRLYVGTARSFMCVEGATYDFFFPGFGLYPGVPESDFSCPSDRYALDLRAEIWRYTPQSRLWQRVYRSPLIPNPRAPGRMIAREIGFRGMVVHRAPNGQRALYVGGVTAGEYIPELARENPPSLLRSSNGNAFAPLPRAPRTIETVFGTQRPIGYRAMEVLKGKLYATVSAGLAGDGVIVEVRRPWSDRPKFVQVSPSTMRVYEMAGYRGALYAGGGSTTTGYAIWKARGEGTRMQFRPILEGGAGRGPAMTSVLTMNVFRGRLYVSATGWYGVLFPESELIRVNPDDSWDLVVGNARAVPGGLFKFPISGLPDGFGNLFNAHFWRADAHGGALFVGTNDMSWTFRHVPILDWLLQPQFGFDVYGTCDGTYWWQATIDAFGDGRYNFGARTMTSTPLGEFIGSANHVQGTKVWQTLGSVPQCGPSTVRARPARAAAATPDAGMVLAFQERCGNVLTWDTADRAARYQVLRARYRRVPQLKSHAPQRYPGTVMPDTPVRRRSGPPPSGPAPWVLGRYRRIGTASADAFVDRRAAHAGRYVYQLTADATPWRSNLVPLPSSRPLPTFPAVARALEKVGSRSGYPAGAARADGSLAERLRAARADWRRGDRERAVTALGGLRRQLAEPAARTSRVGAAQAWTDDATDAVYRLERRLAAATTACAGK